MEKQRLIGSTWTDSKGRIWEVLEMVNPGLYSVGTMVTTENGGRVATRIGKMYVRNIRAAIAKSKESDDHTLPWLVDLLRYRLNEMGKRDKTLTIKFCKAGARKLLDNLAKGGA